MMWTRKQLRRQLDEAEADHLSTRLELSLTVDALNATIDHNKRLIVQRDAAVKVMQTEIQLGTAHAERCEAAFHLLTRYVGKNAAKGRREAVELLRPVDDPPCIQVAPLVEPGPES